MTLRLDSLYDVIVELEEKIEDARLRQDAIAQQTITLENIYKIMVNFDCVYNIINDEEKRAVVTALIKEIEIYRNDESDCPLKRISLNFPVFKDGGEVTELLWEKGNTVETVGDAMTLFYLLKEKLGVSFTYTINGGAIDPNSISIHFKNERINNCIERIATEEAMSTQLSNARGNSKNETDKTQLLTDKFLLELTGSKDKL